MIRATLRGEYDGGLRVALMAAATVYVVSPIDAVPEAFLLVFGLVDDAVMVTWLAGCDPVRDRALPGVGGAARRRHPRAVAR